MSCQSRFDARYCMLGAGALGRPRGMEWGERREEGSGWGTHVYLRRIHFDIWQNEYNFVKFKNKIKLKKIFIGGIADLQCCVSFRYTAKQISYTYVCMSAQSLHSCPTLCDPIDCSLPGFSVCGILQARILEQVATSFSRGIFSTQRLNPGLQHCRQILYQAHTWRLLSLCSRAQDQQLLKPICLRAHVPQQKKPLH